MTPVRSALIVLAVSVLGFAVPAGAQEDGSFDKATRAAEADLDAALRELSQLREEIAAEKLPMTRELNRLENELVRVRAEFDEVSRSLDTRNLDLGNLRSETQARRNEKSYLSTLLDEYVRNFETRVHIAELQRYRDVMERAQEAPERPDLTPAEVFEAQIGLIDASLDRLDALLGGDTFPGNAVGPNGVIQDVEFAVIGPVALYHAGDVSVGTAEQRLGSLEPNMRPIEDPDLAGAAVGIFASGRGTMPFDPTLGNATRVEQTRDTVWQQIQDGGVVMWPILILAAAAFLVALYKWAQLSMVRRVSSRKVSSLLKTLNARDFDAAREQVRGMRGPTGDMLKAAVEHIREPRELIEEVMFEKILESRLKLQSLLSFIALAASAAPLLGLLGTVTGMINTFKLITVFGTGDAQTLSSGISEALLTTQYGLIVAIPSLLLYAFLSRKVRRMLDDMEKIAVSFVNRLVADSDSDDEPLPKVASGDAG
jgi:biopolymer transport protein ExbB